MADGKKTFAIEVTGNNDDARKSLQDLEKMTAKFGQTTDLTSKTVNAGVTIAAAAVVKFGKDSTSTYVDATRESLSLAKGMGVTVEEASKLRYAASTVGVGVDDLSSGVKFLSKNMAANNAEFGVLGVSTRDASGKLRNVHDVMLDTADALSKMANGAEKNAAAQKIFGKGYEALMPLLRKSGDDLRQLEADAEKYGLVIGTDNVAAVMANVKAHREYDAALQGLQIRVGEQVLPLQTKFVEMLGKVPGPLMDAVGPATALGGAFFAMAGPLASAGDVLGPIVGKIKKMSDAQKESGGEAMSLGQKAGTAFASIGVVVGGATVALGIWEATLNSAAKAFDTSMGPAKTKASTASMAETKEMIARTNEQIGVMSDSVKNSRAPWDADYRAEVSAGGAKLMEFGQSLQNNVDNATLLSERTGDSTDKTLAWIQAQQAAGITFDTVGGMVAGYTGQVDGSTLSTEDATNAIAAQDQALKDLNDTLHAAADPLFAMVSAQDKVRDAHLKSAEATNAVRKAQADYDAEVRKHGPTSKAAQLLALGLADAQQKASAADQDAGRSALDLQVAVNTLNEKIKTQPGLLDSAKNMLAQWTANGWLTEQQAAGMRKQFDDTAYAATALGNIDPTVNITADATDAANKIAWIAAALKQLQKDSGNFRIGGGPSGGHYATGTNAMPDGTHVINERGPEIIQKHGSSVQVLTAGRSADLMSAGGGGDTHYHAYYTVQGSIVSERDLVRIISNAERNGVRGPWAKVS